MSRLRAIKDSELGKRTAAKEQHQNAQRFIISSPNFSVDVEIFLKIWIHD